MTPEQLKASIIQCAIQGKLVEQYPEDGTAEDLFQQIQKEREKYKIKELSVEDIGDELFDIPETWKWVHLQDIVKKTIKRGKSPKYAENSKVQVFAQKCNVKTGGINMELAMFLDEASIEKYLTEEYMCDGDIVINSTGGGTMGRVGIFHDTDRKDDMAIVPDGHVTVIRACDSIDNKYLYYFIKHNQKYLETQGEGSTNQTELKPLTIASLVLPLPPLEEQHRIVAKIEELLPYVDRYAEAYEKLEKFNAKFPEDMKKSILRYAIQGKLVEQKPEEGTAEELLNDITIDKETLINEGKIPKEKKLPVVSDDEKEFEIPSTWMYVRVQDIASYITDYVANGSFATLKKNTTTYKSPNYAVFVRTMDLTANFEGEGSYIDQKSYEFLEKSKLYGGELILPNIGGSIGKAFIMPDLGMPMSLAPNSIMLKFKYTIMNKFFSYVIQSDYGRRFLIDTKGGTATPKFSKTELRNMVVMLPPLKEIERIVAKVEELLPFCDRLVK